jgi:hypothetical protein
MANQFEIHSPDTPMPEPQVSNEAVSQDFKINSPASSQKAPRAAEPNQQIQQESQLTGEELWRSQEFSAEADTIKTMSDEIINSPSLSDLSDLSNRVINNWRKNSKTPRQTTSMAASMIGSTMAASSVFAATRNAPLSAQAGVKGGVIGGMAGTQLAGWMQQVFDMGVDNDELIKETLVEGMMEAGMGSFAHSISNGLLSRGMRWATGVTGEAINNLRVSTRAGIDLAISDLTQRGAAWKAIGGVFPIIGRPFTTQANAIVSQANKNLYGSLDLLAPGGVWADVGMDMRKSAEANYKKFGAEAEQLYTKFYEAAKTLPDPNIVPTAPLKEALKEAVEGPLPTGIPRTSGSDTVRTVLAKVSAMEERSSPEAMKNLKSEMYNLFDKEGVSNFQKMQLTRVAQSIDHAMMKMDTSKMATTEEAYGLIDKYSAANNFFSENIMKFHTSTSKTFVRADKNIFRKGATEPGTLDDELLVDALERVGTVASVQNIKALVSKESFEDFALKWYKNSLAKAQTIDESSKFVTVNVEKLKAGLQLDTNPLYIEEMFKGSSIDYKLIKDTVEALSHRSAVVFPAKMVARRFVLGGIGSARNSFLPALSAGGGAAAAGAASQGITMTALALSIMAFGGSKLLANNGAMKALAVVARANPGRTQAMMHSLNVLESFVMQHRNN